MNKIILFILLISFTISSYAQTSEWQTAWNSIQSNNRSLESYTNQAEAERLSNKIGLTPADPTVEAGYLFGTPASTGNRFDLDVNLSFAFPTVYARQKQLAEMKNQGVDLMLSSYQRTLLLEFLQVWTTTIGYYTDLQVYQKRAEDAKALLSAMQRRYELGEASATEISRIKLYATELENTCTDKQMAYNRMLATLQRMNGGTPITITDWKYIPYLPTEDFEVWYSSIRANISELQQSQNAVNTAAADQKLQRAMALPNIGVGYSSERILGTVIQGPKLSLSVPLWERKNTIKAAKLRYAAAETAVENREMELKAYLQNCFELTHELYKRLQTSANIYDTTQTASKLKRMLELGEISLIDYFQSLQLTYDAEDALRNRQLQYALQSAELLSYSMAL